MEFQRAQGSSAGNNAQLAFSRSFTITSAKPSNARWPRLPAPRSSPRRSAQRSRSTTETARFALVSTHRSSHSLRQRYPSVHIDYTFFGGNLGSARGHNELSKSNDADIFLIQNPDVIVAPRLIETMVTEFNTPGVGIVEAKQLPIEHPKDYDPQTGETGWATTACTMIPATLFRELDGFDAEQFLSLLR